MASEKEQFLQTWAQEHATTAKVLAAVPEGRLDFKPSPKSMSLRDLTWHLATLETYFVDSVLAGTFVFAPGPPAPSTLKEIQTTYDRNYQGLVAKVTKADDRLLARTLQFPVAPKQMGDVPAMMILWMGVVMHACHHRGQLSVYLRLLDAKVPSIYGPSGDEPWF